MKHAASPFRSLSILVPLLGIALGLWAYVGVNEPPRILVFSKTVAFRHASIEAGQRAFFAMGKAHGFAVDTTENAGRFNEENLKRYRAVVFLNTTGDVLDAQGQNAFGGQEGDLRPGGEADVFEGDNGAVFKFGRGQDQKVVSLTLQAQGFSFEGVKE